MTKIALCLSGWLALLPLLAFSAVGQAYKLQASIEPGHAMVGDTVIYIVTVTYEGQDPPVPTKQFNPAWGFSEIPGPFSSKQVSWINGQISQSYEYRFPFVPSKEGQFTIPPATMQFGGQTYSSNPVTLTVGKSAAVPAAQLPAELQGKVAPTLVPGNPEMSNKLTGAVFILPVVEKETVYEGEQVELAYHLVIDREALRSAQLTERFNIQGRETPELKQFTKEMLWDLPPRLDFQERVIGGKKYMVAPLYRAAITPVKTGNLEVEPYKLQLQMQSTQPRRGGGAPRSPFANDPFFDDPFFSFSPFGGGANSVRVIAQAPPLKLEVQPVPTEGRPPDYSGAVGHFTMTSQLDKRAAVVGEDVVELKVTVQGEGDASTISPPTFPAVDGLVLLEQPSASGEVAAQGGKAGGSKTFTYRLRPTKAGTFRIPALTLPVFDPSSNRYDVLKTEPQELHAVASSKAPQVTEAAATAQAPPALASPTPAPSSPGQATATSPTPAADDLRYIHTGRFTESRPGALTGNGPAFYLLLAAPPALLLAGWLAGRRHASIESNLAHYRAGRAGVAARRHLKRAGTLLKQDDAVPFYEELARALRGFFGDRFRMEPSGLTIEQIEEELRERAAPEESIVMTRKLLNEADQARYAPVRPSLQEQQRAYGEATQLLNLLEKMR